jgi:hypothetical protein
MFGFACHFKQWIKFAIQKNQMRLVIEGLRREYTLELWRKIVHRPRIIGSTPQCLHFGIMEKNSSQASNYWKYSAMLIATVVC